jgi:hypothetical protein
MTHRIRKILLSAEIACRRLTRTAVGDDLVADLLAFLKVPQAGLLNRAYMHEDILAAFIGLYEAITLFGIKPLYSSSRHRGIPIRQSSYGAPSHARVISI